MLQRILNQLFNQARAKAAMSVPGVLQRTAGIIEDSVVRPVNRFSQYVLNTPPTGTPKTFRTGDKAERLIKQQTGRLTPFVQQPEYYSAPRYTQGGAERFFQEFGNVVNPTRIPGAASLRPDLGVGASAKNTLQTGIGKVGGLVRNLQESMPTALNPLLTRNPTTLLGKTGKFFNPLNPAGPFNLVNTLNPFPGISVGTRLASGLGLTGAAGLGTSVAGGLAGYGALEMLFPQGTADATLKGKDAYLNNYMPTGGDSSLRDAQGRIWAGKDYGFQSPASFNKLFGGVQQTTLGGASPPPPTLPPFVDTGSQAGQLTAPPTRPPAAPAAPGAPVVLSNGAGDPRQRQRVKESQLAQDVLNAAQQYAAPAGVPLSSFYAGQQQLGRSMEQGGELQRRLKELGGSAGMSDKALMDWAKQNPGLAYRELLKLQNRNQQI